MPPLCIPDGYRVHQHQAAENDECKTAYYGDNGEGLELRIASSYGRARPICNSSRDSREIPTQINGRTVTSA
jgi:hypothetical protein